MRLGKDAKIELLKKVPLFSRPVLSELVEGNEQERDDNAPK